MADMVKGFFLKTPSERAPDWVKRKVAVNVNQFTEWLIEHQNDKGYVNFDLLEAPSGHWYLKEDNWQPSNNSDSEQPAPKSNESYKPPENTQSFNSYQGAGSFEDDIPF